MDVEVLRVIDIAVWASLDTVEYLRVVLASSIATASPTVIAHTLCSRSSKMARGTYLVSSDYLLVNVPVQANPSPGCANLVEEHVLAITSLCSKVFKVAILIDSMLLT